MKNVYEPDDLMRMYFVISKPSGDIPSEIKAWSDDKDLIDWYLQFHRCDKFKVKTVTKSARLMNNILDECTNDEVQLYYASTRSPSNPYEADCTTPIPLTRTESSLISSYANGMMGEYVNYNMILKMFPLLKNKYKKSLLGILMPQIAEFALYSHDPYHITKDMYIDEILLLLRLSPNDFGK